MPRPFSRLFKAIRYFGFINGLSVFASYVFYRVFPREILIPRKIKIKPIKKPIWMRPGLSDWIVMERIFLDKEYECGSAAHDAKIDQLQARIASSGKDFLIIDCGANIGLSAIWLSARFPDSKIIAIEPEPANFEVLALNAKQFPNIIPVNAAISDRVGRVALSNAENTPWAWRTEEADSGGLQTITIPQICEMYPNAALAVVKMDIEGFEVNVFRDDAAWIENLPLLIFEMHDWMIPWSGSGHSFFYALSRQKRDYLIQGENMFSYSHRMLTVA